jgi:hypothetical protein
MKPSWMSGIVSKMSLTVRCEQCEGRFIHFSRRRAASI